MYFWQKKINYISSNQKLLSIKSGNYQNAKISSNVNSTMLNIGKFYTLTEILLNVYIYKLKYKIEK